MFDRFERPIKIICLAMAVLLVCQLASLILQGNPLAHLKIPALPALLGTPQCNLRSLRRRKPIWRVVMNW